jgi:hypothetical protein
MAYADAAELARILSIQNPSAAVQDALQRVLDAAAEEIDAYLGLADGMPDPPPAIVVSTNVDWAEDFWKQEQSPYGVVVLGGEAPLAHPGRDPFRRHKLKLLPLKESWGVG